jgi:hypothetical protein
MEKGFIHFDLVIVADQQAPKIAQPSERAFDLPTFAVAAQCSAIVERGFAPAFAMRADEQHALLEQAPAQRVAVVTPVGDDPQRSLLWTTATATRHGDLRQRALGQSYCRLEKTQGRQTSHTLSKRGNSPRPPIRPIVCQRHNPTELRITKLPP